MLQPFDFEAPQTVEEVCRLLAEREGRLIAGGTDVIPQMRDGRFQAEQLIDLSRLDSLHYIRQVGNKIALGGLTTYRELLDSELLRREAVALVDAAALVGGVQTRARGTLAGNLANASPAGDTQPPLLIFDAELALVSVEGQRHVALADFLTGPGKTSMKAQEMIREITFVQPAAGARTMFTRLGNRRGMAISVVSVAALLRLGQDNIVEDARIALGAVAPTAMRCAKSEALLRGRKLDGKLLAAAAAQAAQECSPIDDVRATAAYRRHAVQVLVRRSLQALAAQMFVGGLES
jgi:carbon-monoxide dehydrogenase medium subunit